MFCRSTRDARQKVRRPEKKTSTLVQAHINKLLKPTKSLATCWLTARSSRMSCMRFMTWTFDKCIFDCAGWKETVTCMRSD